MRKPPKGMKRPPGRPAWAQGPRLHFLSVRRSEYRKVAKDRDKANVFYTRVARLMIRKYGYDTVLNDVLPEGLVDPPDSDLDNPSDHEGESTDERGRKEEIYKEVRDKIKRFYQHEERKLTAAAPAASSTLASVSTSTLNPSNSNGSPVPSIGVRADSFSVLIRQLVKPPKKEADWQLYMSLFWQEKLKEGWKRRRRDINFKAAFVRDKWEVEDAELKGSVRKMVEERHAAAMDDYNRRVDAPVGPEDQHLALRSSYEFLQPIAELIAERLGSVVTIMMGASFEENQGEINVMRYGDSPSPSTLQVVDPPWSVHAGYKHSLVDEIWPHFDKIFSMARMST
ncbi:hypothetical protein EWM64_g10247 [Hericium alpestre]|uniref:Uncharacterized protein n=1 Tax=Hericium alpestre TaxID=135208 RepID=A0A4Y9ZG76_9AGAM|nr:hypothetical protein EWM64_g10247 [Hericium alpestre]